MEYISLLQDDDHGCSYAPPWQIPWCNWRDSRTACSENAVFECLALLAISTRTPAPNDRLPSIENRKHVKKRPGVWVDRGSRCFATKHHLDELEHWCKQGLRNHATGKLKVKCCSECTLRALLPGVAAASRQRQCEVKGSSLRLSTSGCTTRNVNDTNYSDTPAIMAITVPAAQK